MIHWGPVRARRCRGPMITWIGPVILMFAAIVPADAVEDAGRGAPRGLHGPGRHAIAAASSAVYHFDSVRSNALADALPRLPAARRAVVISHVVTRLGQQVAKERELGSYQLGELLGRGGMGEVYLATHRMLARPAAIKLIRPEMLAGRRRRRARSSPPRGSAARRRPRPSSGRRTPSSSTTSA